MPNVALLENIALYLQKEALYEDFMKFFGKMYIEHLKSAMSITKQIGESLHSFPILFQ
jgi:hypothetical protein